MTLTKTNENMVTVNEVDKKPGAIQMLNIFRGEFIENLVAFFL